MTRFAFTNRLASLRKYTRAAMDVNGPCFVGGYPWLSDGDSSPSLSPILFLARCRDIFSQPTDS